MNEETTTLVEFQDGSQSETTTTTTTTIQLTSTAETVVVTVEVTSPAEPLEDMSDNVLHQLFSSLGVDLDRVPENNYQCFTMSLQFLAALWFIIWFAKFFFSILKDFLRGRV